MEIQMGESTCEIKLTDLLDLPRATVVHDGVEPPRPASAYPDDTSFEQARTIAANRGVKGSRKHS